MIHGIAWTIGIAAAAASLLAAAADPVLFAPYRGDPRANLVRNGGFEEGGEGWSPYGRGFQVAEDGRTGKGIRVACRGPDDKTGAAQRIEIRATRPIPLRVSGWSRAEGVEGSPGPDYSIYIDVLYADGTPLWGRTGNFRTGTHGWEEVEFIVAPSKPIRSLTVHALLRNRKGAACFDDIRIVPLADEGGGVFEGEALRASDWKSLPPAPGVALGPDGALSWRPDLPAPAGIALRDVAAGTGFVRPTFRGADPREGEALSDLGLALRYESRPRDPRAIEIRIEVEDRTGGDRALTLLLAVPVEADAWWDDATTEHAAGTSGLHQFVVPAGAGASGMASIYPIGCVRAGPSGLALGHPLDAPRIVRYGYDAAWKLLYAAIDLGLAPEKPRADARLVAFSFDARWGFRAAWKAYQELHPQLFEKRVPKEGIWMAFHPISRVRAFEDFGFAFKEGTDEVAFDDAHGILSFRYTEPQSHWQRMPKDADRSYEGCVAFLERRAREGDRASRAAIASAVRDPDGRYILEVLDTPWCDGCVFTLNPNPRLGGEVTKATLDYTIGEADARYGKGPGGEGIDGEYLDSLEGWSLACDFDRSRFAAAETPLAFDARMRRPCVVNIFNIYEFARFVAQDLRRRGKLLMGNSTPIRFSFLMPLLDIAGIEVNWKRGDAFAPDPEWWMNLRRALSGTKPYLLLMNTDFSKWTAEDTERTMRRCLHYAIHPSFFSANASTDHYFSQPALYERDRPLFRRYVPWIRRLGEAGWDPIPHATARPASLRVERYGPDREGRAYWTVLNPGEEATDGEIAIDLAAVGLAQEGSRVRLRRPLCGEEASEEPASAILRVRIRVAPLDTDLIAIEPAR